MTTEIKNLFDDENNLKWEEAFRMETGGVIKTWEKAFRTEKGSVIITKNGIFIFNQNYEAEDLEKIIIEMERKITMFKNVLKKYKEEFKK